MALLLVLSCCSLFVGVIDLTPGELLAGNFEQLEIFIISRLPRLLAILCTGIGMSVAGLIMQRLYSNKFAQGERRRLFHLRLAAKPKHS